MDRINSTCKVIIYLLLILYAISVCMCEPQICSLQPIDNNPISRIIESDIPSAPLLLSPSNGTHCEELSPTFSWSEVLEATSYTLQIDNNSKFSSDSILIFENLDDTSYTLSSELDDGIWYWRVRAQNASDIGSFSEVWQLVKIPSRTAGIDTTATTLLLISLIFAILIISIALGLWHRNKKTVHEVISQKAAILDSKMLSIMLAIIGIITPYAMMYQSFTDPNTSELYLTINFVSILWTYLATADTSVFAIVSDYILIFSLLIFIFQMVFVCTVNEYLRNNSTFARVFGAWIISQIPIFYLSLPRYLSGAYSGSLFYSGPTFITLIVGYIIIRFCGPNEKEIWMDSQE